MSERHSELRIIRWTDRIQDILAGKMRGPIRANVDLTNLCSHACYFCEPVDFRKATIADKRHTLEAETARRAILDLADMDCRAIQFSGGGEPTLHPEFGSLLATANQCKMRTFVVTHGGYIAKWQEELYRYADHIRVSLDSSCDREHRQMHGSKEGEFAKIVDGIGGLVAIRRANDSKAPEIGLAYIVSDCNSGPESFHRFLKLATDLGVDFVQFRPVSEDTPASLTKHWTFIADRINGLRDNFPWLDIRVLGQRWQDVFLQREFDKCYSALTLAVISANGDVAACCDRRDVVFGNINEKPFRDIWLSAHHREVAGRIVPKLCQRCVQCGTNRGIQNYVVENQAVPELL